MIKCEALKFIQGEKTFYMCLIKAKELLSDYSIDTYDPATNQSGYQRNVQIARARKFADYLLKCNGVFNATCLLNIRDAKECKFYVSKRISKNLKVGRLEIYKSLNVVDGQHRIKGLEIAVKDGYNKEALVPTIITRGNKKQEEALSFLIINRTAKGIKADLTDELIFRTINAERLSDALKEVLGLAIERNIGEFARDVSKKINEDTETLWLGRMTLPNESKGPEKTVNLRIFAQSLVDAINSCGALKRAANLGDIDTVVTWLKDYWQAIGKLCPRSVSKKEWNKYSLLRTAGVSTMNKLFGRILDDVGQDVSISKIIASLEKISSLDDAVWNSKNGDFGKLGTSKKNLRKIYTTLEMELDTASLRVS